MPTQVNIRLSAILILLSVTSLVAAEGEPDKGNEFRVVPYLWAINIESEMALGPLSVPVSLGPEDLFPDVEYGGLGYADWSFGDQFVFIESIFVNFDSGAFDPFFGQPLKVDFRLAEIGYGKHYAVGDFKVSPHIGVVFGSLEATTVGALPLKIDESWWGPIVGITASRPISNRWSLTLRAQYSGFTPEVDHYKTALVALNYRVGKKVEISAGYRLMHSDYRREELVLNTDFGGLLVGLQYNWSN